MYIDEIATGAEIKLHISVGQQALDFSTTVRSTDPRTHSIETDVIMKDHRVVNITGKNVIVDVHAFPAESLPMVFKHVRVSFVKNSDKFSYRMVSAVPAVGLNRRECYRVFIGKNIALQCGSNKKTIDAILKDISSSGVAFTVNECDDEDFVVGQVLHTVFDDRLEETSENFSFQIYAVVVRKEELENGKVIYGCLLNSRMPGLDRYIMTKERLRIQNTRGKRK